MNDLNGIIMALPILLIVLAFMGIASQIRTSMHARTIERQSRSFMDEPITIDDPMTPEKNARMEDSIQRALRDRKMQEHVPPDFSKPEIVPREDPPSKAPARHAPKSSGNARPAFGRR